jgi:signal peptidase II
MNHNSTNRCSMKYTTHMWLMGVCAALILIADRLTKLWAVSLGDQAYVVNDWFACTLVFNRGGVWGFLHSESTVVFTLVSVAVAIIIGILLWYLFVLFAQRLPAYDVVCLLAAGMSNLIDRVWYGGVVDFIYLHYHGWSWPVFNIADVVICVSLVYFLLKRDVIHGEL